MEKNTEHLAVEIADRLIGLTITQARGLLLQVQTIIENRTSVTSEAEKQHSADR